MPTVFQLRGRARCSERGRKRVGWITANTHETLWEPLTWAGMESATWRRRTYRKLSHTNPHAGCANQKKNPQARWGGCVRNTEICMSYFYMEASWWATWWWCINMSSQVQILRRREKSPSACQARPSISVASHLSSRADGFLHCSTGDWLFG